MAEYIDRRTALDALYDAGAITYEGLDILEKIPAADVQLVKHGEWIPRIKTADVICSNCGLPEWDISYYCPNCGAKMDNE